MIFCAAYNCTMKTDATCRARLAWLAAHEKLTRANASPLVVGDFEKKVQYQLCQDCEKKPEVKK